MYIKAFLSDICLRPSCSDCRFKGVQRCSDITLADFWGIQNVMPEMDDDKGTSLVLVHSDKGRYLLCDLSDKIKSEKVDTDTIEKYNPSVTKSVAVNDKREHFLKEIRNEDFEITVARYTNLSLYKRARRFAGKVKRKLSKLLGR